MGLENIPNVIEASDRFTEMGPDGDIALQAVLQDLIILTDTGPFRNTGTPDDRVAARIEDDLNNIINQRQDLLQHPRVMQCLASMKIVFLEIPAQPEDYSQDAVLDLHYEDPRRLAYKSVRHSSKAA